MELNYPKIIAIDGPAASGKTTIGRMLAEKLTYLFFDSGLLYRAVTWAAIQQNTACDDEDALILLIDKIDLDVRPAQRDGKQSEDIVINGKVITEGLQSQEVNEHVSEVARHPKVRMAITAMSRNLGLKGKIVMVGRDIGTVVLPEADLKIYLDASLEERARRRYIEQRSKGDHTVTFEEVLQNLKKRDEVDSHRAVSPLKAAEDAIVIQTDGLNQDQVIEKIFEIIKKRSNKQ